MSNLGRVRQVVVLCALWVAAAGAGGCGTSGERGLGVSNVHHVVPGVLVRGAQPDEEGFAALRKAYGIKTVVNFNDDTAESEREVVTKLGMAYVAVPTNPFSPDPAKYLTFLKAVSDAAAGGGGPVYVHCRHGMDRAGMAVACYRIVMEGWDAGRALAELRKYQAIHHGLVLQNIPVFVRGIERDRAGWVERLKALSPVKVPAAASAKEDGSPANAAGEPPALAG